MQHRGVRGYHGRRVGVGVGAEPARLDPDSRGHQDRDPRLVGHRQQRGDRRGQLGRAQVQPPAALVDHGGVAVRDPPPARPADRALERDRQAPRGAARGAGRGQPAGHRAGRGQVGQQPVQVGPGPGGQGAAHPHVELGVVEAAFGERLLEPVGRRIPLAVRRPDGRARIAARCPAGRVPAAGVRRAGRVPVGGGFPGRPGRFSLREEFLAMSCPREQDISSCPAAQPGRRPRRRFSSGRRAGASPGSWTGDAAAPPSPPAAPRRTPGRRPARAGSWSGSRSPPAGPGARRRRSGRT